MWPGLCAARMRGVLVSEGDQTASSTLTTSVRLAVDEVFGRYLGTLTSDAEAAELIESLAVQGVLVVDEADLGEAEESDRPAADAECCPCRPDMKIVLNVETPLDSVEAVMDSLRDWERRRRLGAGA